MSEDLLDDDVEDVDRMERPRGCQVAVGKLATAAQSGRPALAGG